MTLSTIVYGWADVTVTKNVWISEQSGSLFIAPVGTTELNAGVPLKGKQFVAAGSSYAIRGPGICDTTDYLEDFVPAPFLDAGWSIADSASATSVDVTFVTLPVANGVTLTGFQISKDGGAYATVGSGVALDTRTVGSWANGAHVARIRAMGTTPDGRTVYSSASLPKNVTVA